MIDPRCLGPDVDPANLAPDAVVEGASYLSGPATRIGPGAVVRHSRLHDAVIEAGATVDDSIVRADGRCHTHRCDAAGRVVVGGVCPARVAAGATVRGCTLTNVAVGGASRLTDTWARDVQFGARNTIDRAKVVLSTTDADVTISGPTEVSEASLGHHTRIDRRGYFEGVFSNAFPCLEFDESAGQLVVAETLDLPHVSRYGLNTINSTNSGKIAPQPDDMLAGLGPHLGLWQDGLLSHEPIALGPCCWVAPWTKVIGQSARVHADDEAMVNDELMTYVMPFAIAGVGGESTQCLVMPGELSVGMGPKARFGAWVFTYAPDAVIRMVARLHDALPPDRKPVADTIVTRALDTAVAVTRAMAARRGVDLAVPVGTQRRGWPRWLAATFAALRMHRETGMWSFRDGRPVHWRREGNRWSCPQIDRLLAVAPDALTAQRSEDELFACNDPAPPARIAVPAGAIDTPPEPQVDPGATVEPGAWVGPGCRIGPGAIVRAGASVWRSIIDGGEIAPGTVVERSVLSDSIVGTDGAVRSCRVSRSALGDASTADSAAIADSRLAARATVSAFGDLADVVTTHGVILGGAVEAARIDTCLMSMHMAGTCRHLVAEATLVELDGRRVAVPAIPMLGGGSLVLGTADAPVRVACCFIGSNAVIQPGARIAFGCFVLGELPAGTALLPFTLSTGPDPGRRQVGGVLRSAPSVIITHFVNWTFQAAGPAKADAVAAMLGQQIRRGLAAAEAELARRTGGASPHTAGGDLAVAARACTDDQLRQAADCYRTALASGAWDLAWNGRELSFASPQGRWLIRNGAALWRTSS